MAGSLTRSSSAVACALISALASTLVAGTEPRDVPGLVAWYEVGSLHRHMRDGDTVGRWVDSSGNGHDLEATWENLPPRFRTLQLNGQPVVTIEEASYFDVARPFELGDHTIFVVHGAAHDNRALFRSDSDSRHGVILWQDGQLHHYQMGKQGRFPYSRPRPLDSDYSITVLGRRSGVLRAFIDGVDVSSKAELASKIRVGRFFELQHTLHVKSDGAGLRIAEMIFYDRYLTDEERTGITLGLSEEYGIAIDSDPTDQRVFEPGDEVVIDEAAVLVHLGAKTDVNVNEQLVPIGWDTAHKVESPFSIGLENANTKVRCSQDGTRVRLTVSLPLTTETVEARVRALILENKKEYHPEEGVSGPFVGQGPTKDAMIRFQTTMTLDAGDFVEVVTSRDGAPGKVWLGSAGAELIVERIE